MCTNFLLLHSVKEKIIRLLTPDLNNKIVLAFVLIFVIIIIFDSTIVKFSSYTGDEIPTWEDIVIFAIFLSALVVGTIILLNSIGNLSREEYRPTILGIRYFYYLIVVTQIITIAIMVTIIFQMCILNKYSIALLRAQIYVSHISALVFLSLLVYLFIGWLTSKRTFGVLLYGISFLLAAMSLILSLVYLDSYLSNSILSEIVARPINAYVINQPGLPFAESLYLVFEVLFMLSYFLMWLATAIFLRQYRRKMGKLKYFLLMGVPLLYYIFPLQGYFEDIFFSVLQYSPVSYSIAYILVFSATKQVGALLFSLAFWVASTLVYDRRLRKSLLISSIGMAILFSTFELSPLPYHVFPPYGFITQALIPLGSYLLFVGIFNSARRISRDSELRKEFYNNTASQLGLLRDIGISQMERELEKQLNLARLRSLSLDQQEEYPLEEDNVKEILHEVLDELYYSKDKGGNSDETNQKQ